MKSEKECITNSTVDQLCQKKKQTKKWRGPSQRLSNFAVYTVSWRPCEKAGYGSVGPGLDPRFCISEKLPGDADAAGLRTTFRVVKGLPYFHAALLCYFALVWAGRRQVCDSNLRVPIKEMRVWNSPYNEPITCQVLGQFQYNKFSQVGVVTSLTSAKNIQSNKVTWLWPHS